MTHTTADSTASKGFLKGVSIDALRERIKREPYRTLWERIVARTRPHMASARACNFADNVSMVMAYQSRTPMLPHAALLYRLGDDEDALKYVEECIAALDRIERAEEAPKKRLLHSHAEVAIAADICRPGLSDEALATLHTYMREIAIPNHLGSEPYIGYMGGANTCWCRNTKEAMCALLWGEECGYENWREVVDHGIMHTRCYLKHGCDEAGLSFEGMGYGNAVFAILYGFVQLLKQSGYADLYQTEPRLRQIPESTLHWLFPDQRFQVNTNDIGLLGGANLWWMQVTATEYDQPLHRGFWNEYMGPDHDMRPYGDMFEWLCKNLPLRDMVDNDMNYSLFYTLLYWDAQAPATPVEESDRSPVLFSPGTEAACMRTSWSRDAVYVNIAGSGRSAASMTHRHADAGHFSLFAHGDYLAVDTGRYNGNSDQHNVVLVDGKCAHPVEGWGQDFYSGRLAGQETSALLTYCCIDAAHMKGCLSALRHFMFVPYDDDQAYLITFDNVNKDNRAHTNWWQMQANPDYTFTVDDDRHAVLHGDNARLDIAFAIATPESFPDAKPTIALRQDVQIWGQPYGKDDKAKAQHVGTGLINTCLERPRLIAEVTSNWIMAAISPRRKDEAPLPVRQIDEFRVLRMEVDCGDFTDTILAAPDHGCIQLDDVQALTKLALVRRDKSGKVVATWTVDGADIQVQ